MELSRGETCALYARVSKADESQNPYNQLIRLRAYAKDRDLQVSGEYVDLASGANPNRPNLARMLSDARARRFGLVLATKIDRIARSSLDLKLLICDFEAMGIKFECTDQPFSTNTPTGKLLLGILGEIAEFERSLIVERTKAGLARARAQGKRLGHPGLDVGWKGHPRVDLARIPALRAQGRSYRAIGNELGVSHQTVKNRLRKEGTNPPKGKSESGGT
jgi:DNA invertase Pin-like site-specific DNA recombinase